MQLLNRSTAGVGPAPPEAVIQFGGGNFLRAYAEWIIEVYNRTAAQPLGILVVNNSNRKVYREWAAQGGLYHVLTRGLRDGAVVDEATLITNVSRIISMDVDWDAFLDSAAQEAIRYVISNTTEAGIRYVEGDGLDGSPPQEFPARLTAWLHRRYRFFGGAPERGCVVLPMELIEDNGVRIRELVLRNAAAWQLDGKFTTWITEHCVFCNTLVDRIVPGVAAAELPTVWERIGFHDAAVTQGEPYHLLAIEAPIAVRQALPLDRIGLHVVYTDDLTAYRRSKVAILNGAHTAMVAVGYLSGKQTVGETLADTITGPYLMELIRREIIPTLDLPEVDLEAYASDVLDRFMNPFIHHYLLSISLNSVTKFRTRVLPSLLAYLDKRGDPPKRMVLALAALVWFYRGERDGKPIALRDDDWAIQYLQSAWVACGKANTDYAALSRTVLSWSQTWGEDLSIRAPLVNSLTHALRSIGERGMEGAVRDVVAS